jgi:hypothetical protein
MHACASSGLRESEHVGGGVPRAPPAASAPLSAASRTNPAPKRIVAPFWCSCWYTSVSNGSVVRRKKVPMTARNLHHRVTGQLVEKIRSMVAFGWIGHLSLSLSLDWIQTRSGSCVKRSRRRPVGTHRGGLVGGICS